MLPKLFTDVYVACKHTVRGTLSTGGAAEEDFNFIAMQVIQ